MTEDPLAKPARRRAIRRLWIWGAAVAALSAIILFSPRIDAGQWIRTLGGFVDRLGGAGPALYAALYVLVAVIAGPAWLVSMTAGFVWGLWKGLGMVTIGATLGAAAAFQLARHAARRRVERLAQGNATFGAIDRAVAAHGWKVVLLLRMSPVVPYTISNYLYGLTAIRFWPYVAATAVGSIPVSFLYVSLGATGRAAAEGRERSPLEWTVLGVGLAATIVVTILVTRAARRELSRHAGGRMAESAAAPADGGPRGESS
ncbi:MAG TPA: TVP38/TMEM64 family protein [Thermoanaerobaculia bacterium]